MRVRQVGRERSWGLRDLAYAGARGARAGAQGAPMRCGVTDAERQVEASCDAVMGQPNPFSGEGYYLLDDSCLSRSSVGCIGQTGCRLCHTRPASRQGDSVYPWCPQCVCDKWGVSEAGACATSPAPVPEAPAPAPEGDPMRCGATDAERQVEASCDAVMGQPNPFSGEGYYLLD